MKLLTALLCACFMSTATLAAVAADSAQLIASGTQLLQQGKIAAAQQDFAAALKADPKSVQALMRLAGIDLAHNDFTAATDLYKRAIALNPNNAVAFIGMGIASLHGGNKAMSRALFEEALRLEPARRTQLAPILKQLDAQP